MESGPSLFVEEAALTPELVTFGAVLCERVSDHVPALAASEDEYSAHFVVGKIVLVTGDIGVSSLHYDVACFAVVDGVEY